MSSSAQSGGFLQGFILGAFLFVVGTLFLFSGLFRSPTRTERRRKGNNPYSVPLGPRPGFIGGSLETCEWLNTLILCAFHIFVVKHLNEIKRLLVARVSSLSTPDFIGDIEILDFDPGVSLPQFSNITCKPPAGDSPDLDIAFDFKYDGDLTAALRTEVWLNWPAPRCAALPVSITLSSLLLEGRVRVTCLAPDYSVLSIGFTDTPDFDLNVDYTIGHRHTISHIPKLTQILRSRIIAYMQRALVLPNALTVEMHTVALGMISGPSAAAAASAHRQAPVVASGGEPSSSTPKSSRIEQPTPSVQTETETPLIARVPSAPPAMMKAAAAKLSAPVESPRSPAPPAQQVPSSSTEIPQPVHRVASTPAMLQTAAAKLAQQQQQPNGAQNPDKAAISLPTTSDAAATETSTKPLNTDILKVLLNSSMQNPRPAPIAPDASAMNQSKEALWKSIAERSSQASSPADSSASKLSNTDILQRVLGQKAGTLLTKEPIIKELDQQVPPQPEPEMIDLTQIGAVEHMKTSLQKRVTFVSDDRS